MSGPGKVHFLRPGFTVNGRTIPAGTWCGRDLEQVRVGRHPTCGRCLQLLAQRGIDVRAIERQALAVLAAAQNYTEVAGENVTLGGPVVRAARRRV